MSGMGRRALLGAAGALGAGAALGDGHTRAMASERGAPAASFVTAAEAALRRLVPDHAEQFRLSPLEGAERFRVAGDAGRVEIAGSTAGTLLTGVHWYLKYSCGAHVSWSGSRPRLPRQLPAPAAREERKATVPVRFALNDTHDGYTAPYADWAHWEHFLDVLALHGCNAALVTAGQEAVYPLLLREFGYREEESLRWLPAPSHQPWWLLQNLAEYGGPVGRELLARRTALGRRIVERMRELGIAPVLPGYFGTVPEDFAERNPGARTVPQGRWHGFRRPAWLDPRTALFRAVAAAYYRHQRALFGAVEHVKMDLLHEGGRPGEVPVPDAARAVEGALQRALPGATWVILGWQRNPRPELLAGLAHPERMLIVDGLSDLARITDRERDFSGVPYAFGTIPNFGGRTTIGARTHMWAERFARWRDRPGSKLVGTAYMPEATHRDPAAWELFSELAWRQEAVDRTRWFEGYARFRYGADDPGAEAAVTALRTSAYEIASRDGRPHDSVFAARPSLTARSGAHYATHTPAFDLPTFDGALEGLLRVRPELRDSDAYRHDLTDTARQALANRSWLLIGQLRSAFEREDLPAFRALSTLWLRLMRLSDEMSGAHPAFQLGPWLEQARRAGSGAAERDQLERTARVLVTTWGDRETANGGRLANYANRDWQGLIGEVHLPQWRAYLEELEDALVEQRKPAAFDWYAREERWTRERNSYPLRAVSDPYGTALRVRDVLAKAPFQGSVEVGVEPETLEPGGAAELTVTFRNENGLRATGAVDFALTGSVEARPDGPTTVPGVEPGARATARWEVRAPREPVREPLVPLSYELAVGYGPEGGTRVRERRPGRLFVAGPLDAGLLTATSNEAVFGQLGDRFAIDGGGADLWGKTAEFGTVFREGALGEGDAVTVTVLRQPATGPWARAGLVARNTLAGGTGRKAGAGGRSGASGRKAGFVNLAVTPANGVVLAHDADGDGALDSYQRISGVRAPVTLRLSRAGGSWRGELSQDSGATWRTVATVPARGAAAAQDAGLFMTAAGGGSGARGTVDFTDWRGRVG
ncbi:alpha-N-acetylglucosaminidase [Streptomyces sp. AJS327]|uniref:alpha-N-acetylglucosaminidase n=1 Tax=Streptomyces sp. AJS327 TaxID=2545265 RepID=UPI0015DEC12B|nr:alpha-N-acetylglucosaminidase [Streptomyces sp. AJS327]MBA0050118.1 alpha-N-acetylglucosaminidase [Streptomyces sp. AJS327]